ncbi:SUMF1/EgtB/PvdO family nonheme iron enzyme [bacterium]|nr:SUMF1/EgtB/PvdO family nonheme iron enzyme [Verrucomicrobiota bacterium]MDC3182664.1 SUMF1/EgtB/PvdO family nonheme iron enzyme [bacterium]
MLESLETVRNLADNVDNPSYLEGSDNLPVEEIDWADAVCFCSKLNELYGDSLPSGYHYTLLTEAQWEYACRAGTPTRFHYGDELGVVSA